MSAIEKVSTRATEVDPRINSRIDPGADINNETLGLLDKIADLHKQASDVIAKHKAKIMNTTPELSDGIGDKELEKKPIAGRRWEPSRTR